MGVALGYWWNHRIAKKPGTLPPAAAVSAVRPEVPIQDNKTIDFSSGQPVVKESAPEKAIIDAAAKDMADATKNIRFEPTAPPAETKSSEPAKSPSKP